METTKLSLLRNAMDAYAKRRRALSSNIANVDTPGYNRASVSFEEELRTVRNQAGSLEGEDSVEPQVEVEEGPPVLENELMSLSDTQMRTRLASRALSEHFSLLRTGVTGQSS